MYEIISKSILTNQVYVPLVVIKNFGPLNIQSDQFTALIDQIIKFCSREVEFLLGIRKQAKCTEGLSKLLYIEILDSTVSLSSVMPLIESAEGLIVEYTHLS